MNYTIEVFGYKVRGLGFVAVAMSLGGLLGAMAAIIVKALAAAVVVAATKKAAELVKGEEAAEAEEEDGNGDGDDDDSGNGDDAAGFTDPNGENDWDKFWEMRTRDPAPQLPGATPRGRPAPRTPRDAARTGVVEAGFVAVLEAPGVPTPTKGNESASYGGAMVAKRG